jgi:hypothetical protein
MNQHEPFLSRISFSRPLTCRNAIDSLSDTSGFNFFWSPHGTTMLFSPHGSMLFTTVDRDGEKHRVGPFYLVARSRTSCFVPPVRKLFGDDDDAAKSTSTVLFGPYDHAHLYIFDDQNSAPQSLCVLRSNRNVGMATMAGMESKKTEREHLGLWWRAVVQTRVFKQRCFFARPSRKLIG